MMMRAHRSRHRATWLALAPTLALGVGLGIALRPAKPIEASHPAGEHMAEPAPGDDPQRGPGGGESPRGESGVTR